MHALAPPPARGKPPDHLQRTLPGADAYEGPTGELDGLPQPPERPRWLDRLDDWLGRQLSKPTPAYLQWWDRLIDRTPLWAQPLVITTPMAMLALLIFGAPRLKEWIVR